MNNINELIEQLRPFAEYHELHWPDHIGPSTVQYVVRETIAALREQQEWIAVLERINEDKQYHLDGEEKEVEYLHGELELAERQRDAALEALELLSQFSLTRFKVADELNDRTNFAARELERIRGMK